MRRTLTALTAPLLLGMSVTALAEHHPSSTDDPIAAIEHVHGGAIYAQQNAVQADFQLDFGPMNLVGEMTFTPSLSRARLDIDDVGQLVFDGQSAWVSPSDAQVPGPPARFHVLTWPYFVAAPFKLDDPGTNHTDAGVLPVISSDDQRQGTKITFDAGVGDAPDDWYIAFADDEGRMDGLAYIVTATKSKEEAETQPSIILYSDFVEVDGVTFATTWTFRYWDPEKGVYGEPKGTAKLSNFKFVTPDADAFVKPEDAVESKMPGM
ncbi:MAG: hypothetical protein AAF086_06155 [Planctomycetota bacterium]